MLPLLSTGSKVYQAQEINSDIQEITKAFEPDKIFLLTDEGAYQYCFPLIEKSLGIHPSKIIIIPQGDVNKHIETAQKVWTALSNQGADRHSLLINLGGGMPCDLGGFCAASFKRGIQFINIPTTLLAQVDASIGGKTGINLGGLKNEIGFFANPMAVLIDANFLATLDIPNLLSGYAELLKHAFIHDEKTWQQLKAFDISHPDLNLLNQLVNDSIRIKDHFVENDPKEQNIRKALNFGHTIGHAIETFAMQQDQPMLHGYAVAYGMVAELYLSHKQLQFPVDKLMEITRYIHQLYGHFHINKDNFPALIELMTHDKKNDSNQINFTLLKDIGDIAINQHANSDEIIEALTFYTNTKQP